MKKIFSTLLIAIMALAATSCGILNADRLTAAGIKAAQASTITDEQVALLAKASMAAMDAKSSVAPASSQYAQRLKRLTGALTDADGVPLNFKVYITKDVNAFASPDGSVRVYSGLMDIMSDQELLGIVGHEIGHVLMHHSRNALRNQILTSAGRDVLASTHATVAALTDSQLGDLGEMMVNARYSQKQEKEADDIAYEFLKGAQISPWYMVKAFEKFQKLEQQNGSTGGTYLEKMFSSHPDTQERINRISAKCKADGIPNL